MVSRVDTARLWTAVAPLGSAPAFGLGLAACRRFAGAGAQGQKKKQAEAAQVLQQGTPGTAALSCRAGRPRQRSPRQMGEMMDGMDMGMDRSKMSFFERLFGWLGRLHPLRGPFPDRLLPRRAVHRDRRSQTTSIRGARSVLVVAGGSSRHSRLLRLACGGIGADPEPILAYHRWLGVAIGVGGAGLGIWAWRRPWEDRGAGMILALTVMTIAIAVQGFLGARLTHGMDHMMF